MSLVISLVALLVGVVALVLFFLGRVQRYRAGLLVLALLTFAISIGLYLAGLSGQPGESLVETPVANTPTVAQVAEQPSPAPPVSPLVSPLPTAVASESISTQVTDMDVDLEGCLLFASNRDGDFEIYELREGSEKSRRLTDSPGLDIEPDWSRDGKKIAFASNRDEGAGFQVYLMSADGSDQRRVGEIQPGDNHHPSWSPDGAQIAFQSKRDTNLSPQDDNYDIYVMNSDGSDPTILVGHEADDSEPVWSPDGERIAFLSERSGQDEVYVMNSDGTGQTRLADLDVLKSGLSWSEDGRFLLFEGDSDIYMLDFETLESINLTQTQDINEITPEWVGEGVIAFSSNKAGNWDLYLADVSNPNEVRFASLTNDPGTDHSPSWFLCGTD